MLKFFRNIRRRLLDSGSLRKYLVYAIGEIILVVIGILIALQINNWNEYRKDKLAGIVFLKGIQEDLKQDTASLNRVFQDLKDRLGRYRYVDPGFELKHLEIIGPCPTPDTTFSLRYLMQSSRSFRPKVGSYNSLISAGKSNLISNRSLFDNIQYIYEVEVKTVSGIGENVYESASNLLHIRRYDLRFGNYATPPKIDDKSLLADMDNHYTKVNFYCRQIKILQTKIDDVLISLEKELKNR